MTARVGSHQITEVRMLSPPVVVEQTNQGLPWRAKVDTDAMLRETAMLLTRTADAVVNPSLRVVEKKVRKATQKERRAQRKTDRSLLHDERIDLVLHAELHGDLRLLK